MTQCLNLSLNDSVHSRDSLLCLDGPGCGFLEVQTLGYFISLLLFAVRCRLQQQTGCVCVSDSVWTWARDCWWGWCGERDGESCSLFHCQKDRDRCQHRAAASVSPMNKQKHPHSQRQRRAAAAVTQSLMRKWRCVHTFLSLPLPSILAKQKPKRNVRTDERTYIQSAAGCSLMEQKYWLPLTFLLEDKLELLSLTGSPAVGGSRRLHNTCLSNQSDGVSGFVHKSQSTLLLQLLWRWKYDWAFLCS